MNDVFFFKSDLELKLLKIQIKFRWINLNETNVNARMYRYGLMCKDTERKHRLPLYDRKGTRPEDWSNNSWWTSMLTESSVAGKKWSPWIRHRSSTTTSEASRFGKDGSIESKLVVLLLRPFWREPSSVMVGQHRAAFAKLNNRIHLIHRFFILSRSHMI